MRNRWNEIYQQELPQALAAIDEVKGVVLGFHSTIDGFKRVKAEEVERILRGNPTLARKVEGKLDEFPLEINTPADIMRGLLYSLKRGKAFQLMIRREETFRWTMDNFGYDQLRMGGTSGNMTNSLTPLGFPLIVAYANPLTLQQAELFVESNRLFMICEEEDKFVLKPPREAYQGEGIHAIHWIFEYPAGLKISWDDKSLETPRANRFIAAWNPINNKLKITDTFQRGLLSMIDKFSYMLVAGYHLLSEKYPDGTTYLDYLLPTVDYLKKLKGANPDLKMHFEFASIASPRIRSAVIEYVLSVVDSSGLNEVEIVSALRDIGEDEIATEVEKEENSASYLEGMEALLSCTNLKRLQLHNLGYYITLIRKDFSSPERTRRGMILAASLAASRTLTGVIGGRDEIKKGLSVPFSEVGLAQMRKLKEALSLEDEFYNTGIAEYKDYNLIYIPTKVVEKPLFTVGLGDTISSSAFILGS